MPGRHSVQRNRARSPACEPADSPALASEAVASEPDARRALVIGGQLGRRRRRAARARTRRRQCRSGTGARRASTRPALGAAVRLAIDYGDAAELAGKAEKALKAFAAGNAAIWRMLRPQGVFLGRGPAPKVAFLYTGQGSQYVNMLKPLRESEPIVAATFAEADRIMMPLLGRPLSEYIFSRPR